MALMKRESRISMALEWYDDEAEAVEIGRRAAESGETRNGGFFHGTPCGRSPEFDTEHDGVKWFAVMRG